MNAADTPAHGRGKAGVLPWIGGLFALKLDQFHPVLGLVAAVIMFVPLLVLEAVGHANLWLSFSFGLLFTALCDIVGRGAYSLRLRRAIALILVGALLTALGILMGGAYWALVVLLVFASTLLSYLALAYGRSGFLVGDLLNIWFIISLATSLSLHKPPAQVWPLIGPQALAWVAGGALWLAVISLGWLLRSLRQSAPGASGAPAAAATPAASAPGFSRDLVVFAGLAAVAVALATAVAWGFALPNASWMPVAAIVAIKPDIHSSVYVSGQRVAGALIGGIVSAVLLTGIHNVIVLGLIIAVLGAGGVALHEVNYTLYYACLSTVILIGLGLPHPGELADNLARVVWTLAGVAIALVVMLLANVAARRASAKAPSGQETPRQQPGGAAPT